MANLMALTEETRRELSTDVAKACLFAMALLSGGVYIYGLFADLTLTLWLTPAFVLAPIIWTVGLAVLKAHETLTNRSHEADLQAWLDERNLGHLVSPPTSGTVVLDFRK